MRTGSVSEQPMIELLLSLAAQRASGLLEVEEGKKKRSLWFEGGRVTASKSNLKSETLQSLQERRPEADSDELIALQGALRVRALVATPEGTWRFTPNEPPPARRPIDLLESCWLALCEAVPEAELRQRFVGRLGRFPVTEPASGVGLDALPLGGPLKELVAGLDGRRPLGDVVDFAPMPPADALRGVYLALAAGVVKLEAEARGAARVTREAAPPPEDLIADLFDDALAPAAPPVDAPAAPPAGAEDPALRRMREELARIDAAEDVFAVLGVAWDASDAEYRRAWFKVAQEFHPDRQVGRSEEVVELAGRIFARVGEAWEVLGEPESRQATIDRVIHGKKSEDELAMEKVQDILAAENAFKAGMADFTAGRFVQAHEAFRQASELVPEEQEYLAFYGYTLFKLHHGRDEDRAEEGEALVKRAVDQGVKLHNGWMLAGMIYRDRGNLEVATRALLTALKINPGNVMAQAELKRVKRLRDRQREEEEKKKGLGGLLSGLFGRKKP